MYIDKIILSDTFYFSFRELLPQDFVVYTYNKEGALISDHPDVQVTYFPFDLIAEFNIIIILQLVLFRYTRLYIVQLPRATLDTIIYRVVLERGCMVGVFT